MLHGSYSKGLPELHRNLYREFKAREFICHALTARNGEMVPATRHSRHFIALLHEARRIMDTGFGHHITITSLARQTGVNEFKLNAGFKEVFHISVFDYLVRKRMQAARRLLIETDKPVKEIAVLTGYASGQSFISAFKKYFKATPGSFRKNATAGLPVNSSKSYY